MEESKRSTTSRVVITIIAVLLCLAGGVAGFRALAAQREEPAQANLEPTLVRVNTRKLVLQDFQETFHGYGRVHAIDEARVSSEVQGLIVEIRKDLEVGSQVESGELLFRIDPRDYERGRARAQAQLDQLAVDSRWKKAAVLGIEEQLEVARRELALAKAELERIETLKDRGTESDRGLDAQRLAVAASERMVVKMVNDLAIARIDIQRTEAAVVAAEVDLAQAEDDLLRCEIRAPISGVLEERSVEAGARVAPGTFLCAITSTDRVEVAIALPARLKPVVALGRKVDLRRESVEPVITAQIARIAPKIDVAERSFLVYVELARTDHQQLPAPGTFLTAEIDLPPLEGVYVIPRTALLAGQAFVAEREPAAEGRSRARVVARSFATERLLPDVLITRDARAEGLEIVLDNLEQISNGSQVEIVAAEKGEDE